MINASQLKKYYQKHGVTGAAEHFRVTPKTIYIYLKKYKIETLKQKRDREWYDKLPATPEEYHKKWEHVKNRTWWLDN